MTIEEEIIGPYSVNYVKRSEKHINKPKEDPRTKEEKDLDTKALESIRRKAIKDLESEETTPHQKIDAGWRLLYSYGFEGKELQKSWDWFKGHQHDDGKKEDEEEHFPIKRRITPTITETKKAGESQLFNCNQR